MKMIVRSIIFTIIMAFPVSAQKALQMEVVLPKKTYLLDEPVEIGVNIINRGPNVQKDLRNHSVLIDIVNASGKKLPYKGVTVDMFSPKENELEPGDEAYTVISIDDNFGDERPLFSNHYLPAGSYVLKVYLKPSRILMDSVSIEFDIADPAGEEMKVHDDYIEAITKRITPAEYVKRLRYLADNYPNSVYLPIILESLSGMYKFWIKDMEKGEEADDELIEKASGYSKAYYYLLRKMSDMQIKQDRIELLKRIESKTNSLMKKKIDELLEKEYDPR